MKTKFFMTALALPLAFVACTNEDVFTSAPGAQGETLTVAVTRSGYDADTKAAWVDEKSGASFEWTTVNSDKIGLALLNPADASKVVTNYEMSLIGWSNASGNGAAGSYNLKAQNGVKYTNTYATAKADDNAGSGVFQATGLTVMDGNYIVYHPYNEDFAKAGYMAVDFKTKQTADLTGTTDAGATQMLAAAGNNAFSYSLPKTITKGGQVESDFATRNLSALVKLALTDFGGSNNLKKVILLEDAKNFNKNSNGFLKSAHLNAEKIKTETGINTLESPVYTSMVTLAFNPGTLTGLDDANIYMVAGPRSSSNQYSILLINDQNLASIWNAGVNFTAGNKSTINIKYNSSHDFETLIVTEGDDLKAMLEDAGGTGDYDGETIYILGDLTVTNLGTVAAKDVTIKAYGENPETSLKFVSDATPVTIAGVEGADEIGLKFEVPVTTEIKNSGSITLNGTTSFTELTNNGTLAISGKDVAIAKLTNKKSLTINAGAELNTTGDVSNTSAGTIEVAAVDNTTSPATDGGTWNIGEGTTLTNAGEINNYFTINNFGTIDNENGTYVQKLQGKFIGQYDIAADKRGNYVIEVNSNDQFIYANGTTCTTIRVVNALINATINSGKTNILKNLKVEKRVELTGSGTNTPKLELDNTELNGGLYIINNGTTATISGTAYASTIVINAASPATATAPHLTIEKESIIKAGSIVNNGTGSIKEGDTGIPADVKTLSSTGRGTWDNYPQVVAEL